MSSAVGAERALFVDPASHHFFDDRLFDAGSVRTHGDDLHAPYIHLKESLEALGIPVHTADHLFRGSSRADCDMYMSFGIRRRRQNWPGWGRSSALSSPSSGPSSSPVSTETCPGWLVPSVGSSRSATPNRLGRSSAATSWCTRSASLRRGPRFIGTCGGASSGDSWR